MSAMEQVHQTLLDNPNCDGDNPKVAVVLIGEEKNVLGNIGAVITLDDGRIGLVPSELIPPEGSSID